MVTVCRNVLVSRTPAFKIKMPAFQGTEFVKSMMSGICLVPVITFAIVLDFMWSGMIDISLCCARVMLDRRSNYMKDTRSS